jgi:hypothetical protein
MSTMTLNKKTFRIAGLLLILCLITAAILSGTFAKYTSEYFGQDTALVAKWDLEMKEGTTDFAVSPAEAAQLDLFGHDYNTNILGAFEGNPIIAPGVSGDFTLSMANNSDVAADIVFDIAKTDDSANVPMEYSVDDGASWVGLDGLATHLNCTLAEADESATEKTVNVLWRWAYDVAAQTGTSTITSNDATDTDLGEASAAPTGRTSYKLNIAITATQAKPATEE